MKRLLVIGNGMVAERFLDELTTMAPGRWAVTVIGDEPEGSYNRVLLADVLGGTSPESIVTRSRSWYDSQRISFRAGRVVKLDTSARIAHLADATALGYDHAVFATGSQAIVPPVTGVERNRDGSLKQAPGIHVFRTLDDCTRLRDELTAAGGTIEAAVVGGGLLGLELAHTLSQLGHSVTVVHTSEGLLNAQLDEAGGLFLRRAIEASGIRVVCGRAAAVLAQPGAPPDALVLDSGAAIAAHAVVFAVGTRPRIEAAAASGIHTNVGITIDETLTTSASEVSAIGDCAELSGTVNGLVAPGWEQAEVLARRLSGIDRGARYRPSPTHVRLKVAGIDVASLGSTQPGACDEELVVTQPQRGIYRKLMLRDGVLVGAMVVGDASAPAALTQSIERREVAGSDPIDLLCSGGAFVAAPTERTVCLCNRVAEDTIRSAIDDGCGSLDELKARTRAGTGCGSCVGALGDLLAAHRKDELRSVSIER